MMAESSNVDRLLNLMGEQALFGLDQGEQHELTELAAKHPNVQADEMDVLAAEIELSGLPAAQFKLPDHLQQEIRLAMPSGKFARSAVEPAHTSRRDWMRHAASWSGWVAAAVMLIAFLGRDLKNRPQIIQLTPNEARAQLLATVEDSLRVDWTVTEDEAARAAAGDVVWSNAAQEGYMRFTGLAANDPSQSQYQLWIFDSQQDERYPIDGGVFDIPPGADEVIVPIAAKLDVARPYMFAITIEKPGGVVVSSRERLPLLAKVEL